MKYKVFILALALSLLQCPGLASGEAEPGSSSNQSETFSAEYTRLTKSILLSGIELERFSLNYRLHYCKTPKLVKLIFFGAQEAGAASALAFEICSVKQFNKGRNRPLTINKSRLQRALRTAEVGSIIAASGSAVALAANVARYAGNMHSGFDTRTANKFVSSKLKMIDQLLSQREALVSANTQNPAFERAVIEGKILRCMRDAFVDEYSTFSTNSRSAMAVQNLFYLLNISYNVLGAIGAGVGNTAVDKPRLNGTANVLFTTSGAIAMGAPLLCTAELWVHRKLLRHTQRREYNSSKFSLEDMTKQRELLQASTAAAGSLMPSLPGTERLALYTESNDLFVKQIENETTTMRRLNKIALQDSLMGPAIGSLLMTQGILGTRGYYKYFPQHPKKQLDLGYKGSIAGTVATSMAVVGNAAWLLASLSYEHRLKKQNKLPEQLIKDRLNHLDEVEKIISAL